MKKKAIFGDNFTLMQPVVHTFYKSDDDDGIRLSQVTLVSYSHSSQVANNVVLKITLRPIGILHHAAQISDADKIMWVFGYGSLIWKVDFKYERKVVGHIKGYLRRFYQHSIDHRGIPEKPGRVVTLISNCDQNSSVWGVAYKIKQEDTEEVTKQLDFREKNGYCKKNIMFYPNDKMMEPFVLTLYVATEDNESYAGPASIDDIAKQIISSQGPSGPNKEYVYNLADSMRKLAPEVQDDHLYALEKAVRKLDEKNNGM